MRSSLKKMWLEDFYIFCKDLNPITSEIMEDLLKFEADMRTIQVIYNTMGHEQFNNRPDRQNKRSKMTPKMGYLYPDYRDKLIEC